MKGLEAKTLGLKKVIRHEYKRIVAFMLTVASCNQLWHEPDRSVCGRRRNKLSVPARQQ